MSEPPSRVERPPPDAVIAARGAVARRAWQEAFDLYALADAAAPLAGEDLEALAEVAFFAARPDARLEAKERAYRAFVESGDPVRAAYAAAGVSFEQSVRQNRSVAAAWLRRAERLLEDQAETYVHAYLAVLRSDAAKAAGDVDAAVRHASEAAEIALRTDHRDLHAMALTTLGTLKVATGATGEGFAFLEEAAIAAVNGELSPMTAGITSCTMIAACRDVTDYQRAREWLEATDRWCKRQEVSGFPGICRVHRAEILALQGGWERAEQELRTATAELEAYAAIPPMADGMYALGEIRRLQGDLSGAEEALRQAHALGRTPQPALALIRLGAGQVKPARAAIEAALVDTSWDRLARGRLLAAQVEIALADDDRATARAAADELARIVDDYPVPALDAGRRQANGRVLLAEGDAASAVGELRAAIRSWRSVGAPYEVARARAVLARALLAVGDSDDAELELRAARDEFERLGARPDLAAAEQELLAVAGRAGQTIQTRMTFMFTDIEGSTSLAEAIGDEAWERLLAWHDETLRGVIARGGGHVVNSTGDGFFAAFASAAEAMSCAVAIQGALAEHRRTTGFAPRVRIGLHTSDATQRGADYSGIGIHIAARIAAIAAGGGILATLETFAEAGVPPSADAREVTVRGVATPIRVADVRAS